MTTTTSRLARPRHDQLTRDALLVVLTISTGSVDAISWLALDKVFSAFMTGNFAFLGFAAAGAEAPPVLRTVVSVAAFGAGAAVGGRIVPSAIAHGGWSRRTTAALGVGAVAQTSFLVLWAAVGGRPSEMSGHALIAMSAFAMGIQTAAVFSLGVRAVFTTAATATYTALMGDLSRWSEAREERRRVAVVLCGLVGGALGGALLLEHVRTWAPVLPLALTTIVVAAATVRGRMPVVVRAARPERVTARRILATAPERRARRSR